jgi:hypothetical protein
MPLRTCWIPLVAAPELQSVPRAWLIEQESRTGARATLNNQQRRSARQPFGGFRLGSSGRTVIQLVKKVVAKIGSGLPRCFIEVSVVVAGVHVLFPPLAGGSVGGLYRIVHTGTWSGVYSFPAQGVPQMCK